MTKTLTTFAVIALLMLACRSSEDQPRPITQGSAQFGFDSSPNGRMESGGEPSALQLTVADGEGNTIMAREEITLQDLGEGYLTESITFDIGDYELTEFFVLNDSGAIIYAAPIDTSLLADLVDTPLPLAFSVSKDDVSVVRPQVLSTEAQQAGDFGYPTFTFEIVPVIDIFFLPTAVDSAGDYALTSAEISVFGVEGENETLLRTAAYGAELSAMRLRDESYSQYKLLIVKDGYQARSYYYSKEELDNSINNPLTLAAVYRNTYTIPSTFGLDDEVTFYFDAAGTVFEGYTDDIFIWAWADFKHRGDKNPTGISTDFSWNPANPIWKMTSLGSGLYSYSMVPQAAFELLPEDSFVSIGMDIRSEDGSLAISQGHHYPNGNLWSFNFDHTIWPRDSPDFGSAQVTIEDADFGPYSILWSDGGTAASRTDLADGEYTITVTDASGRQQTRDEVIRDHTSTDSLFVTGTTNDWDFDQAIPFSKLSDNLFEVTLDLDTSDTIRFTAERNWQEQWGKDGDDSVAAGSYVLRPWGSNVSVIETGNYTFTIDVANATIDVVKN